MDSICVAGACYEASYLQAKARVRVDLIRSHSTPTLGHLSHKPHGLSPGNSRCVTEDPSLGGNTRKLLQGASRGASKPHTQVSNQPSPGNTHTPPLHDTQDSDVGNRTGPGLQAAPSTASQDVAADSGSVVLDMGASTVLLPDLPPTPSLPPPSSPPTSSSLPSEGPKGNIASSSMHPFWASMSDSVLAVLSCGMWTPAVKKAMAPAVDSTAKYPDCVCPKTAAEIQERLRTTVTSKLSLVKVCGGPWELGGQERGFC